MPSDKGVLLVNLGTPDSPSDWDVWRYLNEFLLDPRVIDIPWLKRQLLVRGAIIPLRFKASAASYRMIWDERGSPLKYHTLDAAKKLGLKLGSEYRVEAAMRYRNPTIRSALDKLKGVKELIVIPLFPQYASATTGSIYEKVMDELKGWVVLPKLKFIDCFYDHPKVIEAFSEAAKSFDLHTYDKVLFSFHGLPKRQLEGDNSYLFQSYQMAELIATQLKLNNYEVAFQSRLGKEPWIEPYTVDTIKRFAEEGARKVLVFCPAFVADCLETLHEIGVEYAADFKRHGGQKLDLVPSLNSSDRWVEALNDMVIGG